MVHRDVWLTDSRGGQCVRGRGFIYANGVSVGNDDSVMGGVRSVHLIVVSTLAVGRGLQVVLSRDGFIWRGHVELREGSIWRQGGGGGLLCGQIILSSIPTGPHRGLTLSLIHLMEVGPSSDDDYLSVAWVVQVRRQLPLSRSIPAHVEAYLDNDEYNDNYVPVQLHFSEMSVSGERLS